MNEHISLTSPQPDAKDIAYSIIKGTVSSLPIPIVSGVASELMSLLLAAPISKRQENWVSSIAQGLVDLQEKVNGFNLENLSENEGFVTTILHATQSALQNHQSEKLETLRNSVLNSALPNPPEDDLQILFIGYINDFTTWHIRILNLFDDPIKWASENNKQYPRWSMAGSDAVLLIAYPELEGKESFFRQIYNDLTAKGLANISPGTMTIQGLMASRSTLMGKNFLRFISTPLALM